MNTAEVDLDRLVDYEREYRSIVKKAKVTGNHLIGLCPFHEDSKNSFSVDLKTGQWHCFAEDIGGNYVDFVAKHYGISTKDAYKRIMEDYHVDMSERSKEDNAAPRRSYTMEQYSFEKKLPVEFLRDTCHVSNDKERKDRTAYMKIPYLKEDGTEATYRKRFAAKEFRWRYGSSGKICLYGEWRLPAIRQVGYACLVEGESDSQSMWYMGVSTLGVPGASMFKPEMCNQLQDLKLYIHQEPDQGGETFLRKVVQGLRDGGFIGDVYKFSCSTVGGIKDPSDLYIKFGKEEGAKKIQTLLKNATPIDLSEADVIPESIEGAPVNLRQPEGWVYSDHGISHIDEKTYGPVLVCRTPIILTQRLRSLDTGEEKIEIAFKRDDEWHRAIYPRSTIFTARGITTLADLGCTITSENAKQVVRFLSALEAENIDIIAKADAASTFGWQPGKRFIPGRDKDIVLDIDPSQRGLAAAYCQTGSFDKWKDIMAPHRVRDKFRFILASSFAAPLLRIIKQRIFFVYNWGSSKGGKTAGLKAALSAWGDPEQLMTSFNATQVGLERMANFYCDLPLGIDERQSAGKNQDGLEQIIYMISSGKGKLRGSKGGGLQVTRQWRTVALATGEEPLSTSTSQTGVGTRMLEIYGGPFETEEQASLMHQEVTQNFGWAGPAFIEHILKVSETSICDRYDEMLHFVRSIAKGKSGSHVAGVSAVALADAMIDTWFFSEQETQETGAEPDQKEGDTNVADIEIRQESWDRAKDMAAAILKEQMSAESGDVNENAVQFITDWVVSNRIYFGEKAIGTCLGYMSESGNVAYIFPSILNQALTKAGYSPRKTLKYMADKGLIDVKDENDSSTKRYSVVRRFDGRLCRVIAYHIGKESEADDDIEAMADEAEEKYEQESFMTSRGGFVPVEKDELPFK